MSPEMRRHLDTVLGWVGYGLGYGEADAPIRRAQTPTGDQVGRAPSSEAPSAASFPSASSGREQTWQGTSHNGSKPSEQIEGRVLQDRVADRLEEIGTGLETASAWVTETVGPMKVVQRVRDGFRARVESGVASVSDRVTAVTRAVEQRAATWRESSARDLKIGRIWWPDSAREGSPEVQDDAGEWMQDETLNTPTAPSPAMAPPTATTPAGVSVEDRPVEIVGKALDAEPAAMPKPLRYIEIELPKPSISETEPGRFQPEAKVSNSVETHSVPNEASSVGSLNLSQDPEPAAIADDSDDLQKVPDKSPTGLGQDRDGSFSLRSLLPSFLRRWESQPTTLFGSSPAGAVPADELSEAHSEEHPVERPALERLNRLLQVDREREGEDVSDRPTGDRSDIH